MLVWKVCARAHVEDEVEAWVCCGTLCLFHTMHACGMKHSFEGHAQTYLIANTFFFVLSLLFKSGFSHLFHSDRLRRCLLGAVEHNFFSTFFYDPFSSCGLSLFFSLFNRPFLFPALNEFELGFRYVKIPDIGYWILYSWHRVSFSI